MPVETVSGPTASVSWSFAQLLPDPLGQRGGAAQVAGGDDHGELLAAHPADDVGRANRGAKHVRDLVEQLVADSVAVDVVHLLEVVEIEHHHGDGVVLRGRRQESLPQPVVEGTVVVEAGECVGLGLVLQARPDVRVVDRERGGVAESLGEEELLVGELRVLADAVDVERALELSASDERHCDERLGLDRRAGNEAHARVEMRLVGEDGLAMVDGPAGDALAEGEALALDLVLPLAAREDGAELALGLVGLVDVHVLVRDENCERVGDALEDGVEALLGEHVVEDVREPPIRLGGDEAHVRPRRRLDVRRVGHAGTTVIGRSRNRLDSASAKIRPRWRRPTHGTRFWRA